jgi:dihydroxyacetone kinase
VEVIMEGIMAGSRMQADAPDGYACLVNNLGGVPPQEMCVLMNSLRKSKWASSIKLLIGPAPLCTSVDMNGVSISMLRLTPTFADLLKDETSVGAWPKALVPAENVVASFAQGLDPLAGVVPSDDAAVSAFIDKVCNVLIASKVELDTLDSKVGDADCGSTMFTAASKVLEEKAKLPLADAKATCSCLSAILGKTMGGSSGVLMSIMFMGMASSLETSKQGWKDGGPQAFMDGLKAMMDAGGASVGSRTMLDALVPAAEALIAGKGLAGANIAAAAGAEATKTMAPRAGRTENVPESVWRNVPDPGARAAAIVFAAVAS